MNTNEKALELFEKNEYEAAIKLFHEAVEESRNIQSLNNLAWIYFYEEENDEKALELIKEVINMNPASYFPYNLLGEIYIGQEKWNLASSALMKSLSIQPSNEAYHNLAVVKYKLGDVKEASDLFLRVAGDSDVVMYAHVKCLIDLGLKTEARKKLNAFNVEADDYVGDIEVADLYVELECFTEATYWFEKGYNDYAKMPDWISRFIYALYKTNNIQRIHEVIDNVIHQKDNEIKETYEEECDEDWTEKDKEEYLERLFAEKSNYENMAERILTGYIPEIDFEPITTGACYLFGCKRHNHPEYKE